MDIPGLVVRANAASKALRTVPVGKNGGKMSRKRKNKKDLPFYTGADVMKTKTMAAYFQRLRELLEIKLNHAK